MLDVCHVQMVRIDAGDLIGEVFNVGCGERIWLHELWHSGRQATKANVEAVYGPAGEGDVPDFLPSLEKSRERLRYEVAVHLDEGLRRSIEWLTKRKGTAEESS